MQPQTGVLLVNLGTPDSYRPRDVYRYLIEFLTDSRVMDLSWIRRQLLVRGAIVPFRYRQTAHLYKTLWTDQGSPLLVHGRALETKLQAALGDNFKVCLAMRYQNPSIASVLEQLRNTPLEHLIVLPLFPQYASATTGSVHQKVMEHVKEWTAIPKLTFLNSFAEHPAFIQAFCAVGKTYNPSNYDHILFSFHGLPERQIQKIDKTHCYKAQCYTTANLISAGLQIPEDRYSISFQSRLGSEPWLQPYTTDTLKHLVHHNKKRSWFSVLRLYAIALRPHVRSEWNISTSSKKGEVSICSSSKGSTAIPPGSMASNKSFYTERDSKIERGRACINFVKGAGPALGITLKL